VYANAGHPTAYVLDAAGAVKARLESTDIPLAILPGTSYGQQHEVLLAPGDTCLLLTDGLEQARSPEGAIFGSHRVLETARAVIDRPAAEILHRLFAAVREFGRFEKPGDDITAVVFKVVA
jgi:sigma-B regulation protein RsbU (phosphoserine phosphatase)